MDQESEFKPLSPEGVPVALEKAKHYRLLNEASEAESICLDILRVDKDNQEALQTLLLALTDKFDRSTVAAVKAARDVLPRVKDEYTRIYLDGLICERWAKAVLRQHRPRYQYVAYEWLTNAMAAYEQADRLHPAGHEEAVLRWNTCVRILRKYPQLGTEPEGEPEAQLLE